MLLRLTFYLILLPGFLTAQVSQNMNMLDRWDDNSLPVSFGAAYNDIWGYVDVAGNEYALVGTIEGVYVFDVTNQDGPGNGTFPDQVGYIAGGSNSLWRDMKTYQNYAYMCADQGSEGLTIIDLSGLPNSVSLSSQTTAFFTRAHNIYIDEAAARMYVAGSNTHSGGLIVLDISNPANPTEIGDAFLNPAGYVHDVFVRGDTAYCSHGSDGLYIYDFTNADAPVILGSVTAYPEQGYNHSSWLTADGDYLVFADETHGTGLKIMDVTNFNSLSVPVSNVFRSTLEAPGATNSIAHNPFILGDSVYISYYHDGVQVFDISNPSNVTNAGYFDTEPNNTDYSGFDGCWGVYPFLPSGNIIASDQLNGLFVLELAAAPVPAELTNWYGNAKAGYNELFWETASENNTKVFVVERSRDGKVFQPLTEVPAAGFSVSDRQYSFRDQQPFSAGTYYRLKTVDLDGSSEYSQIVHLYFREFSGDILRVYPTLAESGETIIVEHDLAEAMAENLDIRLLDAAGRQCGLLNANGFSGPAFQVKLPQLAAGLYYLQIIGARTNYVERIQVR